jgi:hypothetical protein
LEKQRWGRDFAAAVGRTTLTCLAFNTAQVYRLQAGERLAAMAIRRLRRQRQRELGSTPAVLYVAGCYGVFSLEEVLSCGAAPRRRVCCQPSPSPLLLTLPPDSYLQMSAKSLLLLKRQHFSCILFEVKRDRVFFSGKYPHAWVNSSMPVLHNFFLRYRPCCSVRAFLFRVNFQIRLLHLT